ncbi:hypothetical protein SKAU_G00366740 [Synaphobranchus kaupii]|uniref:Ig-like domain-containing protein n=1 Tax=Synaphobranchus kaupii TaxID=118154 RepID=A0A9Q1IDE9_SYNKA|nr:hypothetical protein SKAU_G00366740 [Synaphobranchus kaupii]
MYTHGTRSDECQRSSGAVSPTQSCVYNFPKRSLSLFDAGTYYCAVATCGEILFGHGTKLDFEGSESQSRTVVLQQPESESVQPGASVTLQCTVHTETCAGEHSVYWFRQGSGESPPGIIYTHGTRSDECQRSSGAVSPTQSCVYNFPKRSLSLFDAGTYYCAVATCGEILFGHGTKLDFEGSESQSRTVVLQQPESDSVQPGDSVTLQCTVHTETCAGEHSVYWFRQGSGESPPGIIYTHGNRSDECQRSSGAVSPTQSCVYNFPKRNLSRSDAGTYYCAVATCGKILFGNGTKLDFKENRDGLFAEEQLEQFWGSRGNGGTRWRQ